MSYCHPDLSTIRYSNSLDFAGAVGAIQGSPRPLFYCASVVGASCVALESLGALRTGADLACFFVVLCFLGAYLAFKAGLKIDASGPNRLEI